MGSPYRVASTADETHAPLWKNTLRWKLRYIAHAWRCLFRPCELQSLPMPAPLLLYVCTRCGVVHDYYKNQTQLMFDPLRPVRVDVRCDLDLGAVDDLDVEMHPQTNTLVVTGCTWLDED